MPGFGMTTDGCRSLRPTTGSALGCGHVVAGVMCVAVSPRTMLREKAGKMKDLRANLVAPALPCAAIVRAVVRAGVVAVAAGLVHTAAIAQEPVSFVEPDPELFPPNTLVSRIHIDDAVLENVTNTAQFVTALREHLMVEASMPLDEPLWVTPRWNVVGVPDGMPYTIETGRLGFGLEGGSAVSSDLASAVCASHEADTFSDWEEEAAWAWFLEALEDALADPAMMQGLTPRGRDDSGRVPVRIAAVHSVPFGEEALDLKESFERDYLELGPGASFGSSAMADWEAPEGLAYDTQMLFFELEPSAEAERAQQARDAFGADLTAIELPADALDRFVGNYEIQPGVILEVWREGGSLIAATRDDKTDLVTLIPFSKTGFWTEVEGERMTLTFAIDGDGAVESATMERTDFTMTMPRVP